MLASLNRAPAPDPARRKVASAAALARMAPADRELERQIAAVRFRLIFAQTSFGRRMALTQLELLEGRRSPAALQALAADRGGYSCA